MSSRMRALRPPRVEPMPGPEVAPEVVARLVSATRLTAVAGIAFALLFLVSFWLLTGVPGKGATQQEMRDFYDSDRRGVVTLVALYLFPFAGIAFLWFVISLRAWLSFRSSAPIDDLLSSAQLVSGVIYLTLFFAAAASMSVNAVAIDLGSMDAAGEIDLDFPLFGHALFFVFAIRMGAMFVTVTTTIGRRYHILPGWFVLLGYGVGITLLVTASFNRALILVFPIWTLALSVIIFMHARSVSGAHR